jgi:hypothetical protein
MLSPSESIRTASRVCPKTSGLLPNRQSTHLYESRRTRACVRPIALVDGALNPASPGRKAGGLACRLSYPLHSKPGRRNGLVTDVSGRQRNASPGTLTWANPCNS